MIIINLIEIVVNFLVLGIGLCFWMIGIFMALMFFQLLKDGFTK